MRVLIIGAGQIGSAIKDIIGRKNHEVYIRDVEKLDLGNVDVLHICYPDSPSFVKYTKSYIAEYRPKMTLIHSSIGIGKTDDCGPNVVHCPVRGRHPFLSNQIPAFPIFVGGKSKEIVREACEYLSGCDLVAKPVFDPVATEVCKLLSNVHMGLEIAWRQEVARILQKFCIDPTVYEEWEDTYNAGYRITDNEQLTRPRMKSDPIGGHCILECTEILQKKFESKAFEFIKESNDAEKTKRNGHGNSRKTERRAVKA